MQSKPEPTKQSAERYPKLSQERKRAFLEDLRLGIRAGAVKLPHPKADSSSAAN